MVLVVGAADGVSGAHSASEVAEGTSARITTFAVTIAETSIGLSSVRDPPTSR